MYDLVINDLLHMKVYIWNDQLTINVSIRNKYMYCIDIDHPKRFESFV